MDLDLDIDDDMGVVDGQQTLRLTRRGEQRFDADTGEVNSADLVLDVPGCLINMISDRNMSSVRQVFQRGMSITDDKLKLLDTSIDVPAIPILVDGQYIPVVVKNDDSLQEILDDGTLGREWMVIAADATTFGSRWHVACRSLA